MKRADGSLLTPATWMRNFVTSHSEYRQDSVVSPKIARDLSLTIDKISRGELCVPELFGDIYLAPLDDNKETLDDVSHNIRLRGGSFRDEMDVDSCRMIGNVRLMCF